MHYYYHLTAACFPLIAQAAPLSIPNSIGYFPSLYQGVFPYSYQPTEDQPSSPLFSPNLPTTNFLSTLTSSIGNQDFDTALLSASGGTNSFLQPSTETQADVRYPDNGNQLEVATQIYSAKNCNDPDACQICTSNGINCIAAKVSPDPISDTLSHICPISSTSSTIEYPCIEFTSYIPDENCHDSYQGCQLCPPDDGRSNSCVSAQIRVMANGDSSRYLCPASKDVDVKCIKV